MRSGSFSSQITLLSSDAVKRVDTVRKNVTFKLFSSVVKSTPVDTGRLRGNWVCAVLTPDSQSNLALFDKQGDATTTKVFEVVSKSTAGKDIFLNNSLAYANRIEFEGWSHTKAPEGMVRINVVRFNGIINADKAGA